jgi:hypothetical protein
VHEFEEAPVEESSQAKRTSARASSRNNIPTFEFFMNNPICIFEKDRYFIISTGDAFQKSLQIILFIKINESGL